MPQNKRINPIASLAIAGLLAVLGPSPMLLAGDKERKQVLDCVSRMEVQTTWDQCRRLMFLPCEPHAVGSAQHLACLDEEKLHWTKIRDGFHAAVLERLTSTGGAMLTDLTGQWYGFVGQKCGAVAKEKADISADAARSGCEISEIVGLSAELQACLDGRSTSPYCTMKE